MPTPNRLPDLEKGTLKVPATHIIYLPTSTILVSTEKPNPPPKKLVRKVSRRIRFVLWFNTYRFAYFC